MGMDMKYFSDFARMQPAHEDKIPKSKEFTLSDIKQTLKISVNFYPFNQKPANIWFLDTCIRRKMNCQPNFWAKIFRIYFTS